LNSLWYGSAVSERLTDGGAHQIGDNGRHAGRHTRLSENAELHLVDRNHVGNAGDNQMRLGVAAHQLHIHVPAHGGRVLGDRQRLQNDRDVGRLGIVGVLVGEHEAGDRFAHAHAIQILLEERRADENLQLIDVGRILE
jgi:hypothetical protein